MCLCTVFCWTSLYSQEEVGNGLLFPQFENGIVVFKNGTRSAASLNYSMLQQKMLFSDNGNVMEFADPTTILLITIGEQRFFPIGTNGVFYEEIIAGNAAFFIQHKANMISQGKEAGYGGYSQTSATTSFSSIEGAGGVGRVELVAKEKFKLKVDRIYYIRSGNNYKRFVNAKSLGKLFKGQSAKIESFAKEQSINFLKIDDVAKIIAYSFSL